MYFFVETLIFMDSKEIMTLTTNLIKNLNLSTRLSLTSEVKDGKK